MTDYKTWTDADLATARDAIQTTKPPGGKA